GAEHDSGLVMYPAGHARNTTANLEDILAHKFQLLGSLAVQDVEDALDRLSNLSAKSAADIAQMYTIEFGLRDDF
ncbi:MAG: hypothetical protein AAFX05_15035, partial [Planctomycetota bacterium]